jgi:VWFA-related protein
MLILGLITAQHSGATYSQDSRKPKREEFGSSLKDLKWDSKTLRAVEQGKKPGIVVGKSEAEDAIRLESTLAVFSILVTDANGVTVSGLKKEDFVITEDGEPQRIEVFTLGDDARRPRSIVFIIEWSNTAHYVRESLIAAEEFVSKLAPEDTIAVVTGNLKLLCEYTRDKAQVIARLRELQQKARHGPGRLPAQQLEFTSLFAVLKELIDKESEQPIIVLQADAGEAQFMRDQREADRPFFPFTKRKVGLGDIYAAIEKERVTIYSINTWYYCINERLAEDEHAELIKRRRRQQGVPNVADSSESIKRDIEVERLGQQAMDRVAALSGGLSMCLDSAEKAPLIYSQILSTINNRYIIGYYPTNRARDGGRRSVRIQVRGHSEYAIHGRRYYYATTETPKRKSAARVNPP